jgi:hypothetical protein
MAKQNRTKATSTAAAPSPVAQSIAPVLAQQSAAEQQPETQHTSAAAVQTAPALTRVSDAQRQTVGLDLIRVAESADDVDGFLYDPRGRHATLAESLAAGELAPDAVLSDKASSVALTLRSVETAGIVTAVTLAPSQTGTGFVLVDGRQRYQIARHLGLAEIPATVVPYPRTAAEGLTLVLASTVTVRTSSGQDAAAVAATHAAWIRVGCTTEQAAQRTAAAIGWSEKNVHDAVKVWSHSEEAPSVGRLVATGAIPPSAYQTLATAATGTGGINRADAVARLLLHHLESGLEIKRDDGTTVAPIVADRKIVVRGLRILAGCFAGDLAKTAEVDPADVAAVAAWAARTPRIAIDGTKVGSIWPKEKAQPPKAAAPDNKKTDEKKADAPAPADKGSGQPPPSNEAPAAEGSTPAVETVTPAGSTSPSTSTSTEQTAAESRAAAAEKERREREALQTNPTARPLAEIVAHHAHTMLMRERMVRDVIIAEKKQDKDALAQLNRQIGLIDGIASALAWCAGLQIAPTSAMAKIAESRAREPK